MGPKDQRVITALCRRYAPVKLQSSLFLFNPLANTQPDKQQIIETYLGGHRYKRMYVWAFTNSQLCRLAQSQRRKVSVKKATYEAHQANKAQ